MKKVVLAMLAGATLIGCGSGGESVSGACSKGFIDQHNEIRNARLNVGAFGGTEASINELANSCKTFMTQYAGVSCKAERAGSEIRANTDDHKDACNIAIKAQEDIQNRRRLQTEREAEENREAARRAAVLPAIRAEIKDLEGETVSIRSVAEFNRIIRNSEVLVIGGSYSVSDMHKQEVREASILSNCKIHGKKLGTFATDEAVGADGMTLTVGRVSLSENQSVISTAAFPVTYINEQGEKAGWFIQCGAGGGTNVRKIKATLNQIFDFAP